MVIALSAMLGVSAGIDTLAVTFALAFRTEALRSDTQFTALTDIAAFAAILGIGAQIDALAITGLLWFWAGGYTLAIATELCGCAFATAASAMFGMATSIDADADTFALTCRTGALAIDA